jgi:hypothetical protein
MKRSLEREVTQTLNISAFLTVVYSFSPSATKKKYKKLSCAKTLARRGIGMRGKG